MSHNVEPPPTPMRTILVIDDDQNTRTLLCLWIEELGLKGEQANNGHSGLSRLALTRTRGQIDGIVLDFHMPFFGGDTVLQELADRFPALPVIVAVEPDQHDETGKAIRLGARAFVTKPIDRRDFQQKCAAVFLTQGRHE